MKDARREELKDQLIAAEAALVASLRDLLPQAVVTGDMLFLNSRFRSPDDESHWVSSASESLLGLATESLGLRGQLELPVIGSPGQLYIKACSEAADPSSGHRRGPRQLAAWLMNELGPN